MKFYSRITAILISAILFLVSIPVSALPMKAEAGSDPRPFSFVSLDGKERTAPDSVELTDLDKAVNQNGVYLHYTTSQQHPFVPGIYGDMTCGVCGNTGVDNSTSSITAEYYSGDARNQFFYFSVYYSTEEGHDFFTFSINGEVIAERSGEETEDGSGLYNFNMLLERNQTYVFTWTYTKDGSGSDGNDCVMLMDVHLSRHLDTSTAAAMNAPGCPLVYVPRGTYPSFVPCEFDGRKCATPFCSWQNGAGINARLDPQPGDVITFDYYCYFDPDEYNSNHRFTFGVNNVNKLEVHESTDGWQTYSYTITEQDDSSNSVQLGWGYSKPYDLDEANSKIYIDNVNVIYNSPRDLNAQLNPEGSHLVFTSNGEHPFICFDELYPLQYSYAVCGNRYMDDSLSTLCTTAHILAGEMLVFNYYISSEDDDHMLVKVNGELLAAESGTDNEELMTAGIRFRQEGDYTIEWSYKKDGSVSRGDDCLKISEVHIEHTLDSALNVPGGRIPFYTSIEYPFVPYEDGSRLCVQSTNRWDNQIGALACDIYMHEGDTLTFEYWIDSLQGHDGLIFAVNGDYEMTVSGEYHYWQQGEYTCTEEGVYRFEWIFVQSDFTHSDINCVRIDNVSFSGVMPVFGDLNDNGVVDIPDALIALRGAMGLIELDAYHIFAADVDASGTLDLTDALMILRAAMGLL